MSAPQVIIVIEDVNDNSPNFTYIEKVVTIPENIPQGFIITTVVATDLDKPDTAASIIKYNITDGNGTGIHVYWNIPLHERLGIKRVNGIKLISVFILGV